MIPLLLLVPKDTLVLLRHRTQDALLVGAPAAQVSSVAASADPSLSGRWSEDWYLSTVKPSGYAPPTPAAWHLVMDAATLSTSVLQAGYVPTASYGAGDRRLPAVLRVRVTETVYPIYVLASSPSDALAKAKPYLDAVYSVGGPTDLSTYAAIQNGQIPCAGTPLPWAGWVTLGVVTLPPVWRSSLIGTAAPYDAAVLTVPAQAPVPSTP